MEAAARERRTSNDLNSCIDVVRTTVSHLLTRPPTAILPGKNKSECPLHDSMLGKSDVVLHPIGLVRTSASRDDIKLRSNEFESTVEIYPEFQDALEGLQGFSHIFVISYFNQLRPDQIGALKVKPRRLLMKGFKLEELPLVGVFAIDSPTRPNPIGLTLVELISIDRGKLRVRGLDCFDGTLVLDIKPYRADYRTEKYELADWYRELRQHVGEDV